MAEFLENYYNNKKIKTILGGNTVFEGNMHFKETLKICGSYSGTIKASGVLIVGEDAVVNADISAKSVVIYGTVKGDVLAEEKIEMFSSGRVYGNVKAKKFKISDGVIFDGKCETIK